MEKEIKVTQKDHALESDVFSLGVVSTLTCPECHGVLVRIQEGKLTRYRCHTGHGFTAKSLLSGVTQTVEDSVWNAIRALEEVVMLLQQAANELESASPLEPTYQSQMKQAQEQLALLRSVVMGNQS